MVVHVNPSALKTLTDQIRENFVKIKDDSWRAFLQNAIQITSDIWPEFKAAIAGLAVVNKEEGKNVRRRIAANPYWMGLPGTYNSIGRDKLLAILNANGGNG